uniref:Putative xaa-pro aminopeptidase n=1 Tax=Panstrongylus lignarius TaxID=156445 RepID=A0A224XLD9_9HEMI
MSTAILSRIRDVMKNVGYKSRPIQALIVTNHDAHMSEYLADCDRRLEYVSGFSGTAGVAIITEDEANMWTDGRYFIQAAKEMDSNWKLMKLGVHGTPTEGAWLSKKLKEGDLVGTDPRLIPYPVWLNLESELVHSGIKLVPLSINFVDEIWKDRPLLENKAIKPLGINYAGETSASKVKRVWKIMKDKSADMVVLSALDDIAWLLNLRGQDISYNPVFFSFLVVTANELHLYIDEQKITESIKDHFKQDNLPIEFHSYNSIYSSLESMVNDVKKVWICRSASFEIYKTFPESKRVCECSPIAVMKAVKNEVEVQGMRNAHIKDGVALCRYFAWLEKSMADNIELTEISAAEVLEGFRKEEADYIGPSFHTISSTGPHAAITHYIPKPASDRALSLNEIYLCDSGAQYLDGTTDVTRTVHFGMPTEFQKNCFTRVYQGVVAIAAAKFPYGIKGNCLDSFARKPLWDVGLDYKHGTGHGIGSYLFVHEGPMGISWRPYPDDPGLQPNMFLSDEPGYYHEGEFGIRIENIVQIVPAKTTYTMRSGELNFLTFTTITMCPIQTKMLEINLLTDLEINFLNDYHKKIRNTLGPILKERGFSDVYRWLEKETAEVVKYRN